MGANLPYNATLSGAMGGLLASRSFTPTTGIADVASRAASIAHAAASLANEVGTVQVASLSVACTTSDLQTLLQNAAEGVCSGLALGATSDTDTSTTFVSIAQEIIGAYNAAAAKVTS